MICLHLCPLTNTNFAFSKYFFIDGRIRNPEIQIVNKVNTFLVVVLVVVLPSNLMGVFIMGGCSCHKRRVKNMSLNRY